MMIFLIADPCNDPDFQTHDDIMRSLCLLNSKKVSLQSSLSFVSLTPRC